LCQLSHTDPENLGLLALMLLHDSRRDARTNAAGELVTLEEQNRSLWIADQIEEGVRVLERALGLHHPGPYQLQAAIAAVHAEAPSAADTDWAQIAALYRELVKINPSAVVTLNHAAAVAMSEGPERGLELIDALGASGELEKYHLYHAARADLLRRINRREDALAAYRKAIALAANQVEADYLRRRVAALQ
jgi:RNA polymerase sigma-70 factor (ECF subfamily)